MKYDFRKSNTTNSTKENREIYRTKNKSNDHK